MNPRTPTGERAGLTLLELVVVLVILVLVAGAALTASGGLVDEARYETTNTGLAGLESALLGRYDAASRGEGSPIAFVADMGRAPRVASTDPDLALAELWERPLDVPAFAIQAAPGDPEVVLPGGWRGPYVRPGFGSAKLVDGWGRPYLVLDAADVPAPPTTELRKLRTLGAHGIPGGAGYDADAQVVLESSAPLVVAARHLGAVPVRVRTSSAPGESVYVRLYGARDGAIVTLAQSTATAATGADVVHTFTDVPVGPRVLRAYRTAVSPATIDAPFDSGAVRSEIRALEVVQGGLAEIGIELP